MPKILEINGFRFYIYTNDHLPIHLHVIKAGNEVRVGIEPEIVILDNYGFKSKDLRQVLEIIELHITFIKEKWHEIHGEQ